MILLRTRTRLLAGIALAAAGVAAGLLATTPSGCQSRCASDCPNPVGAIVTEMNVDPGIMGIGWLGPACPLRVTCYGDGRTTFCNRIDVVASGPGTCEVWVDLAERERMAVRFEFGPLPTEGCCPGYPVVGESTFVIPLATDAGIQGLDGSSDAVRIIPDGGDGDAADAGAAD